MLHLNIMKKSFLRYFAFTFVLFFVITYPKTIYAQTPTPLPPINFPDLIQIATPNFAGSTVGDIISSLIPYIYGLAGFALLIFIVLGGYQVMVSRGDPKQMAAGKEKITWAIVGFIILFTAYWIVRLVGEILNIQQIRDIFS